MILPKRPLSILITGLAFCACTGATLGENEPGDDTYLEGNRRAGVEAETSGGVFCRYNGSIAVDHRSEMAFVLASAREGECDPKQAAGGVEQKAEDAVEPAITKTLFAATPDGGRALRIADLSAYTDLRLLFPAEGVLLMAERDGGDELRLLHESSYAEVARKHAWVRYHGTRMSPSRRFLAVADNTSDEHPIHVIDTRSLRGVAVPHDGDTLEAVWANGSDRLVAVVFYETWTEGSRARVVSWKVGEEGWAGREVDGGGLWVDREVDVEIDGLTMDLFFSFSWVRVSPDDRLAAIGLRTPPSSSKKSSKKTKSGSPSQAEIYKLAVVDLETGDLRIVDDARGPVGFTPDSSTIVSYRYTEPNEEGERQPLLAMIDTDTLEVEELEIPFTGGPQYFVTREGNFVVVAHHTGAADMVLYDFDSSRVVTMKGLKADLTEMVSRGTHGELWIVDEALYRLDLLDAIYDRVDLGWVPEHINVLPGQDLLVLDDPGRSRLVFWSPVTGETAGEVTLPFVEPRAVFDPRG